jgi:hypothetical protein
VIRARAASLASLIDEEHANDTRPEAAAELLRELEDLHRHGVLSDVEVGVAERRLAGQLI